ncbi:MAG TPA: hypothetical protein VKA54_12060 [Gemmatimonadaceae bacterium]|nr:hypothetical protein [Gemmatimonadaceae bacterium]
MTARVLLVLLVTTLGCVQRRVAFYPQATIATGPAGFLSAAPGSQVVFENGRMVHYPIPFVWSGGALLWQTDSARVRPGAVFTLPDPLVRAVYQRFTHPVRGGYGDVRGTIRVLAADSLHVVVDASLRSDSGSWSTATRIRYRRRRPTIEP